jgi:hypothetical protein
MQHGFSPKRTTLSGVRTRRRVAHQHSDNEKQGACRIGVLTRTSVSQDAEQARPGGDSSRNQLQKNDLQTKSCRLSNHRYEQALIVNFGVMRKYAHLVLQAKAKP